MIVAADADFHTNDGDPTWAETIGFWFAVPEAAIFGNVYVLTRPNVGATISSVAVVAGHHRQPYTVDHVDPQMHVPCPPSMARFELTSGLNVAVQHPPTSYQFDYDSVSGQCRFDLRLDAIMSAWDPHDPTENPLLNIDDVHGDLGLGDVWASGHFDFVGQVRGSLRLGSEHFHVSSMGAMDRSWGPRAERGTTAVSYLHIPFNNGFAIHLVMALDALGSRTSYGPLRFGYVVDNGRVVGVTEARMSASTIDHVQVANHIVVLDAEGRRFEVRGAAVASAPWYSFSPAYSTFQSLMRYELDGGVAYGVVAEVWGGEKLAAAHRDTAR